MDWVRNHKNQKRPSCEPTGSRNSPPDFLRQDRQDRRKRPHRSKRSPSLSCRTIEGEELLLGISESAMANAGGCLPRFRGKRFSMDLSPVWKLLFGCQVLSKCPFHILSSFPATTRLSSESHGVCQWLGAEQEEVVERDGRSRCSDIGGVTN